MENAKTAEKSLWEVTDIQCLLRHKQSGRYYSRFTLNGKQKWVALRTKVYSVAKLRHNDETKKTESLRNSKTNIAHGKARMGELMEAYLNRSRANSDFRPPTVVSQETALKKLFKTGQGLKIWNPNS